MRLLTLLALATLANAQTGTVYHESIALPEGREVRSSLDPADLDTASGPLNGDEFCLSRSYRVQSQFGPDGEHLSSTATESSEQDVEVTVPVGPPVGTIGSVYFIQEADDNPVAITLPELHQRVAELWGGDTCVRIKAGRIDVVSQGGVFILHEELAVVRATPVFE